MKTLKVGFIVNPVAGMGGAVGLKGSDGEEIHRRALELGALPVAPGRARQALEGLTDLGDRLELVTWPGEMGADECAAAGLKARVEGAVTPGHTTPEDTVRAAREMVRLGVDLILFTGGDGTARNIYDAVGADTPVLGIPGGVKIHSGVYAGSPAKAAALVRDMAENPRRVSLRQAEVMDIDEEMVRQDRVSARLYGYLLVPHERGLNQSAKAGSSSTDEVYQDGIASEVINGMDETTVYLVAPGTTTLAVTEKLGLGGTLLGIDALQNRQIIGTDLNEKAILALMDQHPGTRFAVLVTVIGAQGYLFGRGNQQLSPRVIRRVGKENIIVMATENKILTLKGEPFLVDTGDAGLDAELAGYVPVVINLGKKMIYPVSA